MFTHLGNIFKLISVKQYLLNKYSVSVCPPCKWSGYAWRWARWWQEGRGREGGRETVVEAGFEMPQSFKWNIVLKRKSFLVSLKFLHIFTLTAEMLFFFGISKGLWSYSHTWYLSREPREFSCKFFLAGVNFYRFNAKNWQFTVYFAVITQKNWQFTVYFVVIYAFFRCKFYSPKILLV